MITLPHTNYRNVPVRRIGLLHSGGVGSTLLLYYIMKDIVDRNLDMTLNVVCVDTHHRFNDKYYAASTAKKAQKLTGFDSDRLIVQSINVEQSVGKYTSATKPPKFIEYEYFGIPGIGNDSDAPQVRGAMRVGYSLDLRSRVIEGFTKDSEYDSSVFENTLLNQPNWDWKNNVMKSELFNQMLDADSDNDTDRLISLRDRYTTESQMQSAIIEISQLTSGVNLWFNGQHRDPLESVQNTYQHGAEFRSLSYNFRGYDVQGLDSEFVNLDSESAFRDPITGGLFHFWLKRPLMGKGDHRDLYNLYYSQDSDLEELFWYTRSCETRFSQTYVENEIYKDSDLFKMWDSESAIYLEGKGKYINQLHEIPLYKTIPHCRKCWKCQTRAHGFREWVPADDTLAWLRSENAFNPPANKLDIMPALVIYDMQAGASFPGPTATDIQNVGYIDGLAGLVGTTSHNNELGYLTLSAANSGIYSQNIRPYMDDAGTMTASIWIKVNRTTGTVLGDSTLLAAVNDFTSIIELQDGVIKCGFSNSEVKHEIPNAGLIDSDILTNIVVTFDSDGVFTSYVNGLQTGQITGVSRTLDPSNHRLEVGFGNGNLYHHFDPISTSNNSNDLQGEIHRFVFMNRALSSEEVADLYTHEDFITSEL